MNIKMAFKMAFKSLRLNKLRTFLTMLGVIIGVTAVALLTTVTAGAKDLVVSKLKRESQMVTLFFTNEEIEFTNDSFKTAVVDELNKMDDVGEFEYATVISRDNFVAIKNADGGYDTKVVDKKVPTSETDIPLYQYDVTNFTNVKIVDPIYFNVRNITIEGKELGAGDEEFIVVDSAFVKKWFGDDVKNKDVVGAKVKLGGSYDYIKITKTFATAPTKVEYETFIASLYALEVPTGAESDPIKLFEENCFETFEQVQASGAMSGNTVMLLVPHTYYLPSVAYQNMLSALGCTCSFELTNDEASSRAIEYTIAGVVKEESSFVSNKELDADEYQEFFNAQLFEMMERSSVGNVYVLNSTENVKLVSHLDGSVNYIDGAHFKFDDEDDVEKGTSAIMSVMMKAKSVQKFIPYSDYMVVSMTSIADMVDEAMNVLTILLTVIACISLVVGGIGIMNIMLVTVSERTREIGIRKAIGAKKSSILTQFLVEALIVTVLGGIIGLIFSQLACFLIGSLMEMSLWMPWWVILLAIGFCSIIGVAFGMYPAVKASKLHPIEALRRE